ncbi:MAG: hypothetical protein ABI678_07755 [Kofleriaceae bacterium]
MISIDAVAKYAAGLPGVTVGARWGNRTWQVGDRGFMWQRPFSKADLKRFGDAPAPAGDILAVIVENLDAKDALLAMKLPGFFTIEHFRGYAAVLIALKVARTAHVRAAIADAHRVAVAADMVKKPKRKPAARRRAKRA